MLRRAPSVGATGYRWWAGGEAGACTESLGSESGDGGCDAAEIDQFFLPVSPVPAGGPDDADADADAALSGVDEARAEPCLPAPEKRRRGGFPPAMPRASGALFLRAERRGGRLILTEVRADEHERRVVFRAERDGGRLRLRFANDDDAAAAPERGGEPEAGGGGSAAGGAGASGVVDAVAVQHGGGGAGELCQLAAVRRGGVEVGAVMMGTI
ncbi:unnamed protein product [Miscanthus lutarioriparius]|uniref:FAF domain-containing protein n=1 Tax=Miscanthus lutarioriparius TaxID=422564 RepID=A0A811QIK4_9POAL|nr:unnamed protein product [Miscanthus lutarioriparius]